MGQLTEFLDNLQALYEQAEAAIFGDENTSATLNGQSRDSLSKQIKSKFDALQAMVQGRLTYETKSAMDAAGAPPSGELAEVWNDSTLENNGLYGWDGSAWVKSGYDIAAKDIGNNIFLDPICQLVTEYPTINGFDHFHNYTQAYIDNPIFSAGKSVKSAVDDGTDAARVIRDFHLPSEYSENPLNIRVIATNETGGVFKAVHRDGSRNILGQSIVYFSAGQDVVTLRTTPPAGTEIISVIISPDTGGYSTVHFWGAAPSGYPVPVESPDVVSIVKSIIGDTPIIFDGHNDYVSLSATFAGYSLINAGEVVNGDSRYPVVRNTSGTRAERLYPIELCDVGVGDIINILTTGTTSSGGTVKIHFRNSDKTIHSFAGSYSAAAGDFSWISEVTIPISAGYISILIDVDAGETADIKAVSASPAGVVPTIKPPAYRASVLKKIIESVGSPSGAIGVLNPAGTQLSHADHYVESAVELSSGLWEYTAGGKLYRVREDAPGIAIAVSDNKSVSLMLVSGQSLSTGSSAGATIDPAASITIPSGMMLCPAGYPTQGPQDVALTDGDITALQYQYADSSTSYSPGMSACYHAIRFGHDRPIVLLSSGIAGKSVDYLRAGNSYANFSVQLRRTKSIIESYGLTLDPEVGMIWNQGEADGSNVDYYNDLNGLFDDYISALNTELGVGYRLSFLIDQVGRSYSSTPTKVHSQIARDRADTSVILSKAALQLQYSMDAATANGDHTHLSREGYFIAGAYWGKAWLEIHRGNAVDYQPVSVAFDGSRVYVDFDGRLFSDGSVVVSDYGFSWGDSAGNTISSVDIIGSRAVLTLSGDASLATGRLLAYGMTTESTGNYLGGNLYMRDSRIVHDVDWPLRNYVTTFEMTV